MTEVVPSEALPPWIRSQCQQLLAQPGHAWLLQGPSGLGQYRLALELARSWLCENATPLGACGSCNSCHAISVHTHADLCLLMPETHMLRLNWPLSEKAQAEIDDKKRKPSREIRVDAMRDTIEFSQRTSARGRGKVVLVFPAEDMNAITANALLKTLEEPPGEVRFILASESAHQLLPTIRSRCLCHTMEWPHRDIALQWLSGQGIALEEAARLFQASGDRPDDALEAAHAGVPAQAWSQFPAAMVAGDASFVRDWPATLLLDNLHKLCHDSMVRMTGATPRFFEITALKALPPMRWDALSLWAQTLKLARKSADHPFNLGLMQEALVEQARTALNSAPH
jgi:DNA polymerase-3 subunit delta'